MIPKEQALIETNLFGLSEEIVKPIHGTNEKQGERAPYCKPRWLKISSPGKLFRSTLLQAKARSFATQAKHLYMNPTLTKRHHL